MGIPDGAHTHGSGGSGLGTAILVLVGVALAVQLAGPVVAAVGVLLHILLIAVAVIGGLAAAAGIGLLAWRLYRWRHPGVDRATSLAPGHGASRSPRHRAAAECGRASPRGQAAGNPPAPAWRIR